MTRTPRKRPSPAGKKRHKKARQKRIAARRRQVPMGGNRARR
ncbi:MAG: hypothetical protein ACLQD9_02695 [Thermoplasmata archaeon]